MTTAFCAKPDGKFIEKKQNTARKKIHGKNPLDTLLAIKTR